MEIAIIAAVLLLWLALGGIVAIIVCSVLKQKNASHALSHEGPNDASASRSPSESYR